MDDAPDQQVEPKLACPECGEAIEASGVSGPVVECLHCHAQFFAPVADDDTAPVDKDDPDDPHASSEAELSELRIKQLGTLRRTAYRTRSYLIIATVGCVWVNIPLVISIVANMREKHGWTLWATVYALLCVAALIGAAKFGARLIDVQRGINADLRARELEEQELAGREIDLSTLSDGSHHERNLQSMFAGSDDAADDQVSAD